MSTYLGRVRRVYTGWRALPGKNLVIFDDCLIEARASALDGLATGGAASAAARASGAEKNAPLASMSPEEITGQHPDNWKLNTVDIRAATFGKKGIGIRRQLRLETADGTRVVEWEARSNDERQIVGALTQALGERFSVAGKQ